MLHFVQHDNPSSWFLSSIHLPDDPLRMTRDGRVDHPAGGTHASGFLTEFTLERSEGFGMTMEAGASVPNLAHQGVDPSRRCARPG